VKCLRSSSETVNNRIAVTSPAGPPGATVDQIQAALQRDAHDSEAAQADVAAILDQANNGDDDPARLVASTLRRTRPAARPKCEALRRRARPKAGPW
jgi:hypothetical protein